TRPVAEPALRQEREFEAGMLAAGNADIGRGEQDVETRTSRPAVDRGDDRLPHPRVMIAHPPIDPGLLAVHGAGERPVDPLGAQIFAFLLGDVLARRQIVAAAKMPVAGTRQDRAADVAILPEVDPSLRDLVRCRLVENVRLGGVVEGDVRDPIELLVIDGQIDLLYWNRSEPDITRTSIGRRE